MNLYPIFTFTHAHNNAQAEEDIMLKEVDLEVKALEREPREMACTDSLLC